MDISYTAAVLFFGFLFVLYQLQKIHREIQSFLAIDKRINQSTLNALDEYD